MGKFKDYYKMLEIEPFSTLESVKSAYRQLARQYHPDLNGGNKQAEERFKQINEAYDTLNDVDKKQTYDQSLRIMMQGRPVGKKPEPPPSKPKRKQAPQTEKRGVDQNPPKAKGKPVSESTSTPVNELFESFLKRGFASQKNVSAKKVSETFSERKTVKESTRRKHSSSSSSSTETTGKRRKGEDVTVESAITPFEAEHGVVKTVNVQHNELCKRCSGTGRVNGLVCTVCHGDKIQVRLKKLDVRIPAGVKNGSKVRVSGEGGRGIAGGEEGDLFLLIKVDVHSALRIEGLDVYCDFSLTITDAVLGAEVDVPTLDGTVKMRVPPQTSSGKVFRLKDQGARSGQNRGDQYVTVYLVSPSSLTPREKKLYEELARIQASKQ